MFEPLEICVMLGGPSGQREVSLQSGAAVVEALRGLGHRVSETDPVDGEFRLQQNTDIVFLALHGTYGDCLLYTSPSPRDATLSRMPSSA